jgi:hypothetical protein
VGHLALMGEMTNVWKVLVGRPEGRRLLERPTRGWDGMVVLIDLRNVVGSCGLDSSDSG